MQRNRMSKLIWLVLLLAGCASPKATVMRYETAIVSQYYADSPQEAEKVALKSAQEYCHQRAGEVVLVSNETSYKGEMNQTINTALSKAGSVIPLVGLLTEDKPYQAKLTFRCQ